MKMFKQLGDEIFDYVEEKPYKLSYCDYKTILNDDNLNIVKYETEEKGTTIFKVSYLPDALITKTVYIDAEMVEDIIKNNLSYILTGDSFMVAENIDKYINRTIEKLFGKD